MRLKKLAIICIVASALSVSICGCNSDDKSDVKNTTTAIETSSTTENETTNGDANDETESKIEETEDLSNPNPDTLVENNDYWEKLVEDDDKEDDKEDKAEDEAEKPEDVEVRKRSIKTVYSKTGREKSADRR